METNGTVKAVTPVLPTAIESALIGGDLSKLDTNQRLNLYKSTCESLGLNPLTKPLEYITLNGKLTLYAKRDCGDQLRKIHKISVTVVSREKIDDIFVVCARATTPDGRTDESIGAVNVAGAKGDNLANAFMKAETKAKRRVTLSICGLGFLDESDVETIQEVKAVEPEKPRIESRRATLKPKKEEKIADVPAPGEVPLITVDEARAYRFQSEGMQIRKKPIYGEAICSYSIELLDWMFTNSSFYERLSIDDRRMVKFVTENWEAINTPTKVESPIPHLPLEEDEIPFCRG